MDVSEFTRRLRDRLGQRLGQFDIRITADELPDGVDFEIVSPEFDGVSHGARIQFVADVVEAAFGLPLTFRPMGVALTPAEADQPAPDAGDDDGAWPIAGDDDAAARPAHK